MHGVVPDPLGLHRPEGVQAHVQRHEGRLDAEDFDFDGKFIKLKTVRGKPEPYGGSRPIIMNAGASPTGNAFAIRNCDAFFAQVSRDSVEESTKIVQNAKVQAKQLGRELDVYGVGPVAS